MFPSSSMLRSESRRPLRERRRAFLCVEELEDRAVPTTALAVPNNSSNAASNPSPSQFTNNSNSNPSGTFNNQNTVNSGLTNQNFNPQSQVGASLGLNSPLLPIATIPPVFTTSGTFTVNNNPTPAVPYSSLNPGDQVAVYTGNVSALPADGSDTTQTNSQANLLGITSNELLDLTGPTPMTNEDVAQYLQAVARPGSLTPLRLALLTVERPGGVGATIGQQANNGQPVEDVEAPPQAPNQPQGGQGGQGNQGGAPQAGLDIPQPNLLAILQAPPRVNGLQDVGRQLGEVRADNVTPPRRLEEPLPLQRVVDPREDALPEEPLPAETRSGVWDAYFSEEGRGTDLTKLVKMPSENHYEEFTLPWYPPALGFAVFLGGFSSLLVGQQAELLRQRRLQRRQWREER